MPESAHALSGAGSVDTAPTYSSETSRTKNLIIEFQGLGNGMSSVYTILKFHDPGIQYEPHGEVGGSGCVF
jgi:hypothetical protein